MSEENDGGNFINIEEDEEEENEVNYNYNNKYIFLLQEEGVKTDITEELKKCEGIQKIEQRSDTGKVRYNFKITFIKFRDKNLIRQHIIKKNKKKNNNRRLRRC